MLVGCSLRALEQDQAQKKIGVSIAIYDFGTGYSALSYLRQPPASVLKIDRPFITSLATSKHDQKLVRAIINMAHDLGYRVVAGGVENHEAYGTLASWRCDVQGYLFAHPLAPAAIGPGRWFGQRPNGLIVRERRLPA